jgi:hypothetical protein
MDDEMDNSSFSESDPDDDEMRMARIDDYRQESSRKENNLQANLAAVACGLLDLAFRSEKALKTACQSADEDFLASSAGQRAMASHLNIARQVRSYADLDLRIEAADKQKEKENTNARRRMGGLGGLDKRIIR